MTGQGSSGNHLFHVALNGDDASSGSPSAPFATLAGARNAIRKLTRAPEEQVRMVVHGGTHYLDETLVLTPQDSGITFEAARGEQVTLSGGCRLACDWKPYRDGIMMTTVPAGLDFTQLFINGKRQIRARVPNYDPSRTEKYSGYAQVAAALGNDVPDPCPDKDADMTYSGQPQRGLVFDPADFTSKRWARPEEAVVHAFQAHYWANMQWQVRHVDWENHRIWFGEGGQQVGAKYFETPSLVNEKSRFYVENVFEELDAPGEWYLDRREGVLYLMPEEGVMLEQALVEVPVLPRLIAIRGCQRDPVHDVRFAGFRIAHTTSTFMETYEIPSLSDWAIHRGGAVFLEGTCNSDIHGCWFDAVGGNAVFVNNYNRGASVTGCTFTDAGDSAVCFVGTLETTNGAQKTFPYECRAENNTVTRCGIFGKQTAGVYISRAKRITAGHNHIHDIPRAGICIGDGTWGGHVIEYNHIHDSCRETDDHGPFNSWGRDRGWCLAQSHAKYTCNRSHDAYQMMVDAMEPVIIRHNFFQEKRGWGLDLDDGASNYQIYNNLCVGVSMKLREGCHRTVFNNIWVNGANSPCFHVGNEDNHDRYFCNITVMSQKHALAMNDLNFRMTKNRGEIYTLIAPPAHGPWLEEIDYNCFFSDIGRFEVRIVEREKSERRCDLEAWRALGYDHHSVYADPLFIDPANNDYRVRPESPARKLGFENFEMGQWGLTQAFPESWWNPGV